MVCSNGDNMIGAVPSRQQNYFLLPQKAYDQRCWATLHLVENVFSPDDLVLYLVAMSKKKFSHIWPWFLLLWVGTNSSKRLTFGEPHQVLLKAPTVWGVFHSLSSVVPLFLFPLWIVLITYNAVPCATELIINWGCFHWKVLWNWWNEGTWITIHFLDQYWDLCAHMYVKCQWMCVWKLKCTKTEPYWKTNNRVWKWGEGGGCRALARILKLPIISERVPLQNGLKLIKMVWNGHFLPVKDVSCLSKWWACSS